MLDIEKYVRLRATIYERGANQNAIHLRERREDSWGNGIALVVLLSIFYFP